MTVTVPSSSSTAMLLSPATTFSTWPFTLRPTLKFMVDWEEPQMYRFLSSVTTALHMVAATSCSIFAPLSSISALISSGMVVWPWP